MTRFISVTRELSLRPTTHSHDNASRNPSRTRRHTPRDPSLGQAVHRREGEAPRLDLLATSRRGYCPRRRERSSAAPRAEQGQAGRAFDRIQDQVRRVEEDGQSAGGGASNVYEGGVEDEGTGEPCYAGVVRHERDPGRSEHFPQPYVFPSPFSLDKTNPSLPPCRGRTALLRRHQAGRDLRTSSPEPPLLPRNSPFHRQF